MAEFTKELIKEWRDIRGTVCCDCGGSGIKVYGSTSTWADLERTQAPSFRVGRL